jgi:nitrogen regulatory protein PII
MNRLPNDRDNCKLITCVLYRKGGLAVLDALRKRGIESAALWHARGSAIGDPVGKNGLPVSFEKEIVVVAVPAQDADEIFEFIFETAEIDRPYGGLLYMEPLRRATSFVLSPDGSPSGCTGTP